MRGWSFGLSVLTLCCGTFGCARSGAPADTAPLATESPGETVTYPVVDAPADVVLWARMVSPGQDLPVLAAFGFFPDDVGDALTAPHAALEILVGAELARLVDLNAPVDFLLPQQKAPKAWTIAFTAHRDVLQQSSELELVPLDARRWQIPSSAFKAFQVCELWDGAAPSGPRVLCSTGEARLAADAPFLMGTAPRHPTTGSLRLAIPGPGYRSELQKVMDEIIARGGDEGEIYGTQLVASTVREHDGIAVDVTLGSDVEIGLEIGFTAAQAPLNAWLASEPTGAGVLPGFWKLPMDAELALSKGKVDGQKLRATAGVLLREILHQSLADLVVSDADQGAIESAVLRVAPTGGGFSFATGRIAETGSRWFLLGVEESGTEYAEAVRELVRQGQRRFPPKDTGAATNTADERFTDLSLVDESPAGLPEGSLHLLLTDEPRPAAGAAVAQTVAKKAAGGVHVFVVPDEPQVWLSWATDEQTALSQVRRVAQAQPQGSLREVPVLTRAAERATSGIGFTTLRGLMGLAGGPSAAASRAQPAALPHRGVTPIPLWFERRAAADAAGTVTVRLAGKLHPDVMMDGMAWLLLAFSSDEEGR